MSEERYSRNESFFGAEGQAKIAATRVATFGLGGLGAQVEQQLSYLGVRHHGLVDFDIVTESSLNRLVGAVPADVVARTKKIVVAQRMIMAIQPSAAVTLVDGRVDTEEAEALVASVDVVFGCLDRDLARLQLSRLCAQYRKPLFDLATDTGGDDDFWYGGRVLLSDGRRCVVCMGLLDQAGIARDLMSPEQRAAHDRIYGVDADLLEGSGPMVTSINGVVASLAVTEFIALITGLREPAALLSYRGDLGSVRQSLDVPEPNCYLCQGMWG